MCIKGSPFKGRGRDGVSDLIIPCFLKVTKLGFQVAAHAGASAAAPSVQETVQETVHETVQEMERNWLSVRAGAGKWGCFGLLRFRMDDIFFRFFFRRFNKKP